MNKRTRPTYSAEFKLDIAEQVIDQGRSISEIVKTMDVSKSAVEKWVKQLRDERSGKLSKVAPLTLDQIKIRELERKIRRLEEDNDILKKASALLMQDSIRNSR